MHTRLFLFFGIPVTLFLFIQCRQEAPVNPAAWYETLRTDIQNKADLQADTMHFEYLADSTFSHRVLIRNGRIFREEWYGKSGDLQGVSLFTPDGRFELRSEIYPDGS